MLKREAAHFFENSIFTGQIALSCSVNDQLSACAYYRHRTDQLSAHTYTKRLRILGT